MIKLEVPPIRMHNSCMMNKKYECPIKQSIHECALSIMDDMRDHEDFEGMNEEELYEQAWQISEEDHDNWSY